MKGHEVLATVTGENLLGAEYDPPFDYFEEERDRGAFRVISSPRGEHQRRDGTRAHGPGLRRS